MQLSSSTTYMTENCAIPFCKGCGHTHAMKKLNEALIQLNFNPQNIVLVTDIGCIGLADMLFEPLHTVHTTHGRSTAFATGIQIADAVLSDSALKTIVLIGDGGAMIGIQHLINAALLNADITVLLCNNFLFGMTGGQNSAFSPYNFITPTTPSGNIIPPIDMGNLLIAAQAGYVARILATDKDLSKHIAEAITYPGFSVVEIIELCTEHATTRNDLNGASLAKQISSQGQQLGVLRAGSERKPFSEIYSNKYKRDISHSKKSVPSDLVPSIKHSLHRQVGIVIAGSAGERVQSAARRLCESAILSGLQCTQKNDNPVTQGSGFSLAEVILSSEEIYYTGIEIPNAVIVVSHEGLGELIENKMFDRIDKHTTLIADESLNLPNSAARTLKYPFRKEYGKEKAAFHAIAYFLSQVKIFPPEIFTAA
jgi:2-oxoglutarate ferredoxin oxidoreductase subunit beta